jgi:staphylococcal nuclease domain-containing protein 1
VVVLALKVNRRRSGSCAHFHLFTSINFSRILHLADIAAPRLGTSTRDDEPWAYESREFLRGGFHSRELLFHFLIYFLVTALAVGKEISFVSTHSLPNDEVTRDFGTAEIGGHDLTTELLKNGWAKLKDIKRDPTEEDLRKRELESEAKAAGKGLWNPHGPQVWLVVTPGVLEIHCNRRALFIIPCLPSRRLLYPSGKENLSTVKFFPFGEPLEALSMPSLAIVEQVRDGTTLRVRLLMPDGEHQVVNIALAGVRSARASSKQGEPSEPWGEEVRRV